MPKTGRSLVGMVAGFIPEWWPVFDRNGGRLHVEIRTLEPAKVQLRLPRAMPRSALSAALLLRQILPW
ncbi:MAG: hypothetical protein EOR05_33190 [Mesorhizobium sp.]|nr:MAG: hypothetical protein EOR05_33190 [Mesorhizobium sp.]